MPGRLTLTATKETLEKRYKSKMEDEHRPRYNVSPSQMIPVILNESPDKIILARWGFKSFLEQPIINARSEEIETNKIFGKSFRERRCLIPADSYYEWEETPDGKQPYRIMLRDESIFSIAGVWHDVDGEKQFATITIKPNEEVRKIHERMPAILRKEDEKRWLSEPDKSLLMTYPQAEMTMYMVSKDVNSSKHDSKEFIKPISKKKDTQLTL